jgi:hypothetical protein
VRRAEPRTSRRLAQRQEVAGQDGSEAGYLGGKATAEADREQKVSAPVRAPWLESYLTPSTTLRVRPLFHGPVCP